MKKTDDVSGTHLWLVLMKAHRALQRLATSSIESSEVGLSDFAVLEMLLRQKVAGMPIVMYTLLYD